MNTTLYQFQVSLFKGDHHLLNFAWTGDKDAVIEAMDSINNRECCDLRCVVVEHDHRHGVLVLSKNGHTLLTTKSFIVKPIDDKILHAIESIQWGDADLKASVITRGNGGISLPDSGISIGA